MKKSEKIVEMQSQIDQLMAEITRLNQLIIDLAAKTTYIPYPPNPPYSPNTITWYYPGNTWYYQTYGTNLNPPKGGLQQ